MRAFSFTNYKIWPTKFTSCHLHVNLGICIPRLSFSMFVNTAKATITITIVALCSH